MSPKKQDDDADDGAEEEEPEKEEPIPEVQAADEGEEVVWKAEIQKLSKMVPIGEAGEKKEESKEESKDAKSPGEEKKAEGPTHRWTERGAGPLTLLRNVESDARRITLRQKGVGKILLNTPLIGKNFTSEGNQTARILAVDGDSDDPTKLCSYRLKFRTKPERDDFIQLVAR